MISSCDGPVAVLWDIENCQVPNDVRPGDVAVNIKSAIEFHPYITGSVVVFSAFGDFTILPRRVREGCHRTGVKLVDVPRGRKEAADKAILVDMFLFALDYKPPATIVLISGDVDFAPALHVLGQRGYNVVIIVPSGGNVNSALTCAGKFIWDWQSIVRGVGFVPLPKPLSRPRGGLYITESNTNDNSNLEDGIELRESLTALMASQFQNKMSLAPSNSDNTLAFPQSTFSRFHNECSNNNLPCLASSSGECSAYPPYDLESTTWVIPGDFDGLKSQVVKLLELSGGCMLLKCVLSEYKRNFRKPLYALDFGSPRIVDVFKKMSDVIGVGGQGNGRYVYLQKSIPEPEPEPERKPNLNSPSLPIVLLRREDKGKDINTNEEDLWDTGLLRTKRNLEEFKLEMLEILDSYGCWLRIDTFEHIYIQKYKKLLDYEKMGVDKMEQLFEKCRDDINIYDDPETGIKLICSLLMTPI